MNETRAVTLSARELGVIQGLVASNKAIQVAIREQHIDSSDNFGNPFRYEGRARSYVVTLYGPSDPNYAGPSPTPIQMLLVGGPGIESPVDVVLLTGRSEREAAK